MKKVIIIGGGIAGLTTALALQKKDIEYEIYEAVPEIKAVGAGISLAGNAMRVLHHLGIGTEVRQRGQLIYSMKIADAAGKEITVMDAEKLSQQYGLDNVAIHRAELHAALMQPIPRSRIGTHKKAIGFKQDNEGVVIMFDDGTQAAGSIAVVADGIHSAIRKQLDPESVPRYSGHTCWRGVVKNEWNLSHHAVELWGAAGRVGYVPIGNNQVYWFACKNAPAHSAEMQRYSVDEVLRNFKHYAEPVPQIIAATAAGDLIWNDIVDLKPIHRFAFGKILLIGDAGHATTPNLGQGACLAMEDALVLANELDQAGVGELALKQFEKKRMARTHYIVNTSFRLGRVAQWEHPVLIHLRNAMMRVTPAWVGEKQMRTVLDV